jgi:hypothetical protein
MSSILCQTWQKQVREFFTNLHGHQSKTLADFVLGAIRAQSLVLPKIAEAWPAESEAKASSMERRFERFLSNPRIDVERTWEKLLRQVMPFFRKEATRVIIDVTSYEEHAQVISVGLLQHSRVFPLVWKVMPGQQKWDQGFWECSLSGWLRMWEAQIARLLVKAPLAVFRWWDSVRSITGMISFGLQDSRRVNARQRVEHGKQA